MHECQSRAADVKYRQLRAQDVNETLMFRPKANDLSVNYSQGFLFCFVLLLFFQPAIWIMQETGADPETLIKILTKAFRLKCYKSSLEKHYSISNLKTQIYQGWKGKLFSIWNQSCSQDSLFVSDFLLLQPKSSFWKCLIMITGSAIVTSSDALFKCRDLMNIMHIVMGET